MAISGNSAVAAEWSLAAVTLTFLLFRGYVKLVYQNGSFNLSDGFIVLAWFAFVSCCACDTQINQLGLFAPGWNYSSDLTKISNDQGTVIAILKIVYGSALPYYIDLWLIKSSLLCFYFTIIPKTFPRLRVALHVVICAVAATFILVISVNAFWCKPIWTNWTLRKDEICFSFASYPVFFISVGSNIITDIMILVLPFPLLKDLHVRRSQTYALIGIFSLGSLCIVATIARVIALAMNASTTQVAVWSAIETATGIIVACLPALRVLLRTQRELSRQGRSSERQGNGSGGPANERRRSGSNILANAARSGSSRLTGSQTSEWIKLSETSSRPQELEISMRALDPELGKTGPVVVSQDVISYQIEEQGGTFLHNASPMSTTSAIQEVSSRRDPLKANLPAIKMDEPY